MPAVRWLPWSAATFTRAGAEHKPVLLCIAAAWSASCAEMDRASYADGAIAALICERFVPVRVDADRRPDIAQRYGLGGWPTTAFLTPDGRVIGGGTYVDPDRLAEVLQGVADAFAAGRHLQANAAVRSDPIPLTTSTFSDLAEHVKASFDRVHGGFGTAPKFPHAAPIRLALHQYREEGDLEWRDIAIKSLDAIGWGRLHDDENGGFFRCSLEADWSCPAPEKLLEVNATLLGLYAEAFEILELTRYADRAQSIVRYVHTCLADPVDGGWAACEHPAARSFETEEGAVAVARSVETVLFADWNASMVSAALRAGRVLNDEALTAFAIRSLERLGLSCYRPGRGVAHDHDPELPPESCPSSAPAVRGLLDDQILMAAAHLDAFEITGNIAYEMMAEELALYAIRSMWDDEGGGFFDRAGDPEDDVGLLRERVKPYVGNCAAATMLRRLAALSGKTLYAEHANRTLAAISAHAPAYGPLAAEFLLASRTPDR